MLGRYRRPTGRGIEREVTKEMTRLLIVSAHAAAPSETGGSIVVQFRPAMLRLGRQSYQAPRRSSICDQGEAATTHEQVVGDQSEAVDGDASGRSVGSLRSRSPND